MTGRARARETLVSAAQNLDVALAFLFALIVSLDAFLSAGDPSSISRSLAATAGILALLAIAHIRDRTERSKIATSLVSIASSLPHASADDVFVSSGSGAQHWFLALNATTDLLLVQEVGLRLLEDHLGRLQAFINSGGRVRLLVCSMNSGVVAALAARNQTLLADELSKRQRQALKVISRLALLTTGGRGSFLAKHVAYPLTFTGGFADLESAATGRRAILHFAGFRQTIDATLRLEISEAKDPMTFQNFLRQAEELWVRAEPLLPRAPLAADSV